MATKKSAAKSTKTAKKAAKGAKPAKRATGAAKSTRSRKAKADDAAQVPATEHVASHHTHAEGGHLVATDHDGHGHHEDHPVEDAIQSEVHADHHDGHDHHGHGGQAHGDHAHDQPHATEVDDVAAAEASDDEGLEEAGAKPDGPVSLPDDDWAAKLAAARSKPVQIEEDAPAPVERRGRSPKVQVDDVGTVTMQEEAPANGAEARVHQPNTVKGWDDMTIPEQYLLVALSPGWDDRTERARLGAQGAALVGALLLDLTVRGKLRIRQDRYEVVDGPVGDEALARVADRVRELSNLPSAQVHARLAQRLTERIRPWKQRLEERGLVQEARRKHLGLFPRSNTYLLDEDAQTTLQNRLMRTLAGSGTPDAQVIALLGLLDASGMLAQMVPSSALEFNRKRIRHLLTGRDPMGYAVDATMRSNVQEACLQTILRNVRAVQNP